MPLLAERRTWHIAPMANKIRGCMLMISISIATLIVDTLMLCIMVLGYIAHR